MPMTKTQFPKAGLSPMGFTLIEAVVAVTIFAIASTSIIGIYLSLQRLNQASASLNALQQNTRFLSEDISKIIRNGSIDYLRYLGQVAPSPTATDLYLVDQDGTRIRIFREGSILKINKLGIGEANFSSREVSVIDFQVFIWPSSNPFPGGLEQPRATIYLDLESNVNARNKIRTKFQVTLATREYPE